MTRNLLLLIAAALLLVACGDEDAERKAEAQATIDGLRADFEAREANIAAALKTAGEWRGKDDVPALDWGDRPEPGFMDARHDRIGKGTNGRVFELAQDGKFNTDTKTLFGLFIDTSWRDDITKTMAGEGYATKGGVEADFEKYTGVRYLCLLLTDEHMEPAIGMSVVRKVKFTPGSWRGRALYFDLEQGELIGGKKIEVVNDSNIDFTTTEDFEKLKEHARNAADDDLRSKIMQAAMKP